jgi:FimV-like protein
MPTSQTVTMELRDPSVDSPTVENPLHTGMDNPTIRHKLESTGRFMVPAAEQTAELALDDLGLDLSAGDTGPHETTAAGADSAPTVLSSMDAETRQMLARADAATRDTAEVPAVGGGSSESGTWLFTDKDFSATAETQLAAHAPTELVTAIMPPPETNLDFTGRIAALKGKGGGEVDLNLDHLAATGKSAGLIDLDVGTQTVHETGQFTQTQRLPGDAPISDAAEPATMSEVGTKLDLARAYMDMGDPEGARSILEEVLGEGSASQKTEARRLIDSLPG